MRPVPNPIKLKRTDKNQNNTYYFENASILTPLIKEKQRTVVHRREENNLNCVRCPVSFKCA